MIIAMYDIQRITPKGCHFSYIMSSLRDFMHMTIRFYKPAIPTGLSFLTNLYIAKPQRFQYLCLRLPHFCLLFGFGVIVSQQM